MDIKKGQVSVTTENIFPIIRQWLYQDKDIFVRELVSNAADALAKFSRLQLMGKAEQDSEEELKIELTLDLKAGTLSIADNGIGMTFSEIEKYINQIAYSGMVDFAERFKDEASEGGAFIGHFGLGFYSSFMVSDVVRIDSKSYQAEPAAFWQSEDGIDYEMGRSDKETRGTTITLTLSEEAKAEFDEFTLRRIFDKFLGFMAWPIYFQVIREDKDSETDAKTDATKDKDSDDASEQLEPINDPNPLWKRQPSDISDEEYKAFYKKVFKDPQDPLFWIHLNMDYPFRLQGILFFPKTDNVYEALDGRIKIYYNQVFVADNIKEIIPDFLFLLRGTLDAPDLPLNVSRSFLQNDTYVNKLSGHIIRKVADKLTALAKDDFETYCTYWKDIALFVKYGMMKEDRFYDRATSALIFETTEQTFKKLDDLGEGEIFYTPGKNQLTAYVDRAVKDKKMVVVMDHEIDNQFMSFLEYKAEGKIRFVRVDAELGKSEEGLEEKREMLEKRFQKAAGDDALKVRLVALGADGLPAMIEESEQSRRMAEMKKQFERLGQTGMDEQWFKKERTLVLNDDSPLIAPLAREAVQAHHAEAERGFDFTRYVYDLARLGQDDLEGESLVTFLRQSAAMAAELAAKIFDKGEDI